jgi:hypothetical protein
LGSFAAARDGDDIVNLRSKEQSARHVSYEVLSRDVYTHVLLPLEVSFFPRRHPVLIQPPDACFHPEVVLPTQHALL